MKHASFLVAAAIMLSASAAIALPPDQETEHVVTKGESLNGIANRAGVPRDSIIEANDLEPPYVIRIGQKLTIPRDSRPARRTVAASSSPASPSSSASPTERHIVKSGETLSGIAQRASVPRVLIAEANGLRPPYNIRIGQELLIPRTRRHIVKPGDTGFAISYKYAVPWDAIAIANGLEPDAPIRAGKELLIPTILEPPVTAPSAAPVQTLQGRFAWPLSGPEQGTIRRGYTARGTSSYHDGIDIVAPRGTAVRASEAGTVIFAGNERQQFGKLVVIDHGDGWHSAYGSLSRVTVKKGHSVTKGERVGLLGDSSITGRTELHFEMRKDGKLVDPMSELTAPR